jgi:hypothetical protein
VTLGLGVRRHGQAAPLVLGGCGIVLMATAVVVGHGLAEAGLTIFGVTLVASAHILNLRHTA